MRLLCFIQQTSRILCISYSSTSTMHIIAEPGVLVMCLALAQASKPNAMEFISAHVPFIMSPRPLRHAWPSRTLEVCPLARRSRSAAQAMVCVYWSCCRGVMCIIRAVARGTVLSVSVASLIYSKRLGARLGSLLYVVLVWRPEMAFFIVPSGG